MRRRLPAEATDSAILRHFCDKEAEAAHTDSPRMWKVDDNKCLSAPVVNSVAKNAK